MVQPTSDWRSAFRPNAQQGQRPKITMRTSQKAPHNAAPQNSTNKASYSQIALTEQQLSIAAAYRIRARLLERFGKPVDDLRVFPTPEGIANASLDELRACGLSRQGAGYTQGFAQRVAEGGLTFEDLKRKTDAEVREQLRTCKDFGKWSIQYVLMRGFGRPDCLSSENIGLRPAIGMYLAHGRFLSPEQFREAVSTFAPSRGLADFYLSVDARLPRASAQRSRASKALRPIEIQANRR